MIGTLYVVGTPIGNLGDITLRAIEVLKSAHHVIAEDTRSARALLSHLGLSGKPIHRCDAHATSADITHLLAPLAQGASIAYMTDAGTPAVSDPGPALVRAALTFGANVVPIPGVSAVTAALSASGLVTGPFRFIGFLPRTGKPRHQQLAVITATPESVILFESPQRIPSTLQELAQRMPQRQLVIARELTKLHEEWLRGTVSELASLQRTWLGEITLVLGPNETTQPLSIDGDLVTKRITDELAQGRRPRDIADALSVELGLPRRQIYAAVLMQRNANAAKG